MTPNDARELDSDERARHLDRLAFRCGFVERANLWVILHGPYARVTEGEFEIAVALLRPERWRVRLPELAAPGTSRQ